MPLVLTRTSTDTIPIEVFDLEATRLLAATDDEIRRTIIRQGRHAIPVGELFSVEGSAAADQTVIWRGDLNVVKGIASGWHSGRVIVEGSPGMHTAAGMFSGELQISGSAGDWLGAEMRGGRITVSGNAGRCVGGAYRGGLKGMTGGEIVIQGDCGPEAGQLMRRGLLAIGGSAGAGLGFGMLAGTIAVGRDCGDIPVAGMKRGLLVSLDPQIHLLPSFCESTPGEPVILRLLVRRLKELGLPQFTELLQRPLRRFWGDRLEGGRGEIWLPTVI